MTFAFVESDIIISLPLPTNHLVTSEECEENTRLLSIVVLYCTVPALFVLHRPRFDPPRFRQFPPNSADSNDRPPTPTPTHSLQPRGKKPSSITQHSASSHHDFNHIVVRDRLATTHFSHPPFVARLELLRGLASAPEPEWPRLRQTS